MQHDEFPPDRPLQPPADIATRITAAQAHRLRIVPLTVEDDVLLFATDRPDHELPRAVEILAKMPTHQLQVSSETLDEALGRVYPDPEYPRELLRYRQVVGIVQVKNLMGFDVIVSTVGRVILAGGSRALLRDGELTVTGPGEDGAESTLEQDDLPQRLIDGCGDLVRRVAEEFDDPDEHTLSVPLTFFGDRVYWCTLSPAKPGIVIEVAPE